MAAPARSVSPGAALLRSSRMFSMPAPIPAASGEYASASNNYSETATKPYPTLMTITTPASSRMKGDWGLKRPLPLKSTTKQTLPLMRVRQVDSMEHITDYQTASDHTITLRKFQELNLPITVPRAVSISQTDRPGPKSVFEENSDITAIGGPEDAIKTENSRWKFKGPWLAGMTEGDFNKWLERSVRAKRPEFRAYLRNVLAQRMTADQEEAARAEKRQLPPKTTPSDISEDQFMDFVKAIRQDRIELYRLVSRFLDLAPLPNRELVNQLESARGRKEFTQDNPYSTTGPPVTHPSAGLSYLRTSNFMENHPLYGPQRQHAPVKGRILKPKSNQAGVHQTVVGIAGFVAKKFDERLDGQGYYAAKTKQIRTLDLENRGGTKVYFDVRQANIDPTGKVQIDIGPVPSNGMHELVLREQLGEGNPQVYEGTKKKQFEMPISERRSTYQQRTSRFVPGNGSTYGISR